MDKKCLNNASQRENFLLSLLNKVTREYKALLELTRRSKPFKIAEIVKLSTIPGESAFTIQITNKNCFMNLTAAEIIRGGYNLNDFSEFHADMIRQAASGKLIEFLKIAEKKPPYKIIEKRLDRITKQCIFTIETKEHTRFLRTTEELSSDKKILAEMDREDVYDVGFTQGGNAILTEQEQLILAKKNRN